jgi:hypothetical protein
MPNLQAEVQAERAEQADLLATLTPEQWNAPTLSAGRHVREVIAHTTAPFRMSLGRTVLDITVGLGLDRRPPPARVALVLSGLRPENVAFFGTDLTGVRLEATDLDWAYGTGTPLRGLAQDLLH